MRAHREKNNPVSGPVCDFLPGRPGLQCVQKNAQFAPNIGRFFSRLFFSVYFFFHARPWPSLVVAPCARRRIPAAAGGGHGGGRCPLSQGPPRGAVPSFPLPCTFFPPLISGKPDPRDPPSPFFFFLPPLLFLPGFSSFIPMRVSFLSVKS